MMMSNKTGRSTNTNAARSFASRAGAIVLLSVAPLALAQGPSFRQVPGEVDQDSEPSALSPNGRFVTGNHGLATIFRSDMLTGAHHLDAQTSSLYPRRTRPDVIDNGQVFTNFSAGLAPRRVYRWTPETDAHFVVQPSVNTSANYYMTRISRDGLLAVGYLGDDLGNAVRPMLYDLSVSPPTTFELSRLSTSPPDGSCSLVGITQPINGQRFIYGNCSSSGGSPMLTTWLAGFAAATPGNVSQQLADVSERAEFLLFTDFFQVHGEQPFVRGGGADWVLNAPPDMRFPWASRISDDGRTVVGDATIPNAQTLNVDRDVVIWRRGRPPQTLRSILSAVGVAMPTWFFSYGIDISSDGSTVLGFYDISNTQSPFGYRSFVAVLPSLNDTCETARPVTYGTTIDSTNGATRAGVSGGCFAEAAAPDIWFSFVPAANETVTIDTCGSSFDTTLTVFQASSCANLGSTLACNDDANPSCSQNALNSRVTPNVFAGQNYFIRVSGWNGAFGSVQLNITAPARPANDTCAQAINLPPGGGAFWNNAGAITDARPSCPGSGTPFSDLWYRTMPTETGRMNYSTCGSSINTVMAVYPGNACADVSIPALACVNANGSCGGSNGAYLVVPCSAGEAQLTRVGGLFGSAGAGQINARFACDANVLSNYAVSVLNAGPRAYWRFDDSGVLTIADTVRSDPFTCGNYPGQYLGSVYRAPNFQGKALELQGDGARAQMDAVPFAHIGDTSVCPQATLEAWIKTTDPLAGVVMTNRNAPGDLALTLVVGYNSVGIPNTDGKIMFIADGPGTFYGAISSVRVDDDHWHHVVGRRLPRGFGYQYEIYVDGLLRGTTNLAGPLNSHTGPGGQYWLVGNGTAWATSDAAFNGMIDEVAIYCSALAPSVINTHYTTGRPCVADVDDGTSTGTPDGGVTIEDLLYYLGLFADGAIAADVDDGSATGTRDGGVTIDDLLFFLDHFQSGC